MLKIQRASINQIISWINDEKPFHAVAEDYSFTLKIARYTAYVCGAVHDGNQFRKSLWDNCTHTAYERWYEEDPATKAFVANQPIVIAGCDSRFEYDLNRAPALAVYEDAWGKPLWKQPLEAKESALSLKKHANFYKVVHALMSKLTTLYGHVVVYDIHSYNWKRWDREVPFINIGTVAIDHDYFKISLEQWLEMLKAIQLPHKIPTAVTENDVFLGKGYFLNYITTHFKKALVLATEFKKVYCDEATGVLFPEVVEAISIQFQNILETHANVFANLYQK
mgnify:CR=1 FL=1